MRPLIGLGVGFALALAAGTGPRALEAQEPNVSAVVDEPWTTEELENLLAPIALYPDPILAQVLVAATYPDQLRAASAYVERYGTEGLDEQPWEISVKAVAHYRPVLNLMAEGEDWTIALGQAYASQPRDVMGAVQSLRRMANAQGNLVTDDRQRVVVEREVIRIEPAQPRVIYVPTYDPAVVYFRPIYVAHAHPAYWSYGHAYPVGVWLTYDFDWWGHRVYYHGWHIAGPHWVVVSRPWVVISPIYVSPRYTTIVVNRRIVHRSFDPRPLRRYTVVHKQTTFDRRGTPGRRVGQADRGRPDDRGGNRNNATPTPGRRDFDRAADRGLDKRNDRANEGGTTRGSTRVSTRGSTPVPTAGRRVMPISGGPSDDARTDAARQTAERRDRVPSPVGGTQSGTRNGTGGSAQRVGNGTWNPRPTRSDAARPESVRDAVTTTRSSAPSSGTRLERAPTPRPRTGSERASPPSVRGAVERTRSAQPSAPSRSTGTARPSAPTRAPSAARPSAPSRGSTATPRGSSGKSGGAARSSSGGSRSSGAARSSSGGRSSGASRGSSRRPE